ncbi:thioesterase domain-containing protein [Paracraurococcus lichenis]|uniref:Thioesterase domain-containing protein n=1 Tax=Paracraurococcus lichenis TaxID=3064888 RepID=A0ABT9E284_9PROT|nr:thioesterase domain-containing protein [Paracraurococcus sp. LOR1-02]MDO9710249.1 thioesterase domain-containing protein [Paracraurococcus sp. LOR1-02]
MHPRPDVSGQPAPARPLLVLIGGAADRLLRKVGRVHDRLAGLPDAGMRLVHYRHHDQEGAILALIAAQPPGTPIRLVGHSWGGHAAARIAARLGEQGRPVDLLITVDPVARAVDARFLARVRAGARLWINARALGGARFHPSDLVAAIGGSYGPAPGRHAHLHLDLPHPHAAFDAMMACRIPGGPSLLEIALGADVPPAA